MARRPGDFDQLAAKMVYLRRGYPHFGIRAGAKDGRRWEVHERVAPSSSRSDRRVLLRRAFNGDFFHEADAAFIGGNARSLDHDSEPFVAFDSHRMVDELVCHLRSFGARPRREHKGECGVELGRGGDLKGAFEVVVGLPWEPDDDVCGH
ncbi:MAG: hypothetical protein ACI9MX_002483 [Candidatus Aldehydirespiratoraceae bacterium]